MSHNTDRTLKQRWICHFCLPSLLDDETPKPPVSWRVRKIKVWTIASLEAGKQQTPTNEDTAVFCASQLGEFILAAQSLLLYPLGCKVTQKFAFALEIFKPLCGSFFFKLEIPSSLFFHLVIFFSYSCFMIIQKEILPLSVQICFSLLNFTWHSCIPPHLHRQCARALKALNRIQGEGSGTLERF